MDGKITRMFGFININGIGVRRIIAADCSFSHQWNLKPKIPAKVNIVLLTGSNKIVSFQWIELFVIKVVLLIIIFGIRIF